MIYRGIAATGLCLAGVVLPGCVGSSGERAATVPPPARGYGMMDHDMMGHGMMGGNSPGPRAHSEFSSRGGRLFARYCAACHALPDPRQHTLQQWPAVVSRMVLHMQAAHRPIPDKSEIEEIDSFLERHASNPR